MDLRDKIALETLRILLTASPSRAPEVVAKWCYELADAMLEARNAPRPGSGGK